MGNSFRLAATDHFTYTTNIQDNMCHAISYTSYGAMAGTKTSVRNRYYFL